MHNQLSKNLVSLVVPCFNVSPYINRLIDSILAQTWDHIELIMVNDGSTDGTRDIISSRERDLRNKCQKLLIIDQENKGLAGAVNTGLQHISGEFLSWPDPDDWLVPESLEWRVDAMRRYPDVGLIRGNAYEFNEKEQKVTQCFLPPSDRESILENAFEDMVFLRGYKAPIAHMARTAHFLDANRSRSIYFDKRSSQNQQMLLPLMQKYPVLEMRRPIGYYCVRDDSRSRAHRTPEDYYKRCLQLLDIAEHVVPKLTYSGDAVEGMKRVRDYHIRNRMLPTLFRGAMTSELTQRLSQCRLKPFKKAFARLLVSVRLSRSFISLNKKLFGQPQRAMNRLFTLLVLMGKDECKWPDHIQVR
jgi:glycosyltransferase involved in cell wall biosynthesis